MSDPLRMKRHEDLLAALRADTENAARQQWAAIYELQDLLAGLARALAEALLTKHGRARSPEELAAEKALCERLLKETYRVPWRPTENRQGGAG